jgi:hypothetical protein
MGVASDVNEGCDKTAEGSIAICVVHEGGRRCAHESGCDKLVGRGGIRRHHGVEGDPQLTCSLTASEVWFG